jgi:hypothetical protein
MFIAMRLLRSLLLVLAAACASEPRWHKAGASAGSIDDDLQQCRLSAPYEPRSNVPAPRTKPGNLIDFNTMAEREGERFMKDERHVSECMRAKGYSDAAQ